MDDEDEHAEERQAFISRMKALRHERKRNRLEMRKKMKTEMERTERVKKTLEERQLKHRKAETMARR
jgi:hypothetical protein